MSSSTPTNNNSTSAGGSNNKEASATAPATSFTLRETLLRLRDRACSVKQPRDAAASKEDCLNDLAEKWAAVTTTVTAPPLMLVGTDQILKRNAKSASTTMATTTKSEKEETAKEEPTAEGEDAAAPEQQETEKKPPTEPLNVATTATPTASTKRKLSTSDANPNQAMIDENMKRYQELLKQGQEEIDAIAAKRQRLLTGQVELWGVYKYGLKTIAGLPDLGVAPDAILPGNF